MNEDRIFTGRRLGRLGAVVVAVYASLLAIGALPGGWLVNDAGGPARTNFLAFWSAGSLALRHIAAAAYDWPTLGNFETQAAGRTFAALPWVYPPTFLLAVAPFAALPYVPAFLAWMAATLSAYLAAIHAILPRRLTLLLAPASPVVFWNVLTTQNGVLTTALLGFSLAFLETRPIVAGIFIGLLTYKPQLGLLFPLVLALTGRWRVIASAAVTALVFAGASYFVFGAETWAAFFRSGAITADAEFGAKLFPWPSLETTYGLVRSLGGGASVAWTAHGVVALATAALVCRIWLRPVAYDLKAASLAVGALIVTPYLLMYDLAAVTVPAAFLLRAGLSTGFIRGERTVLLGLAAVLLYPLIVLDLVPLGPILLAALMGLIVRRATRPDLRIVEARSA